MTKARRLRRLALLCLFAAAPVSGEMEDREYESAETAKPAHVLERRKREIEAELRAASRRQEEARAAEEAARLAREADLAARPYAVRLLEARCETVCHGHERFAHARHGWLGWQAVILRMQYLNGALLDPGERNDLARHLAAIQPASFAESVMEYAIAPAMLATPFLGWVGWRRWRRSKK
ncbi:MAG: hypothetical protein FJY34_11765 [Betaproteobacteria bacterium]|nr:hypothetical protein [Betaproteobacteria bacterium]